MATIKRYSRTVVDPYESRTKFFLTPNTLSDLERKL
jgi:hypothetical protein